MNVTITIEDMGLELNNILEREQVKAELAKLGREMLLHRRSEQIDDYLAECMDDPDSDVEVWNVREYNFLMAPTLRRSREDVMQDLRATGRRLSWLV